jgi:hypothetical protein
MPALDVFKGDAFSTLSLTDAINKVPYKPARIGQLGLFSEKGIRTTTIMIEEKEGQLSLIPTSPRGAPGDALGATARTVRSFIVPHLIRRASVIADEVEGIRTFGSESELQAVQDLVNDRLLTLRAMHEVTLEHLRIGALKGQILDADGLTVLYNLFTEFGVAQQTQDFDFTDTTTDIRAVCVAVARQVEDALGAAVYTGLRAFCSASWFDALIGHPRVEESFRYQEGLVLREDLRKGFRFGGIVFEEYRGSVGGVDFIEDDVAYCFPEGVMTEKGPLFSTAFAPADYVETVNTLGLPIYAKQEPMKFDRGIEIEAQSNPLPLCLRPRSVVELTMS